MNVADIAITSIDKITAFDVVGGTYRFTLDELQSATIANSEEKQDITGKGGRKLTSLKRNKSVTISGNNGLVSGGLLELQTGSTFSNKATRVMWTDYLTVENDAATTTYTAVGKAGTTGKEIVGLFVRNEDGTLGTSYTQDATPSEGKFAYAPASKALTFNADELDDGTEIVVYYERNIVANTLDNVSDVYSEKATLYVDATGEDKCANVYHIQFFIPKADFSGEFSIEFGENQTVHAFEAESLAGSCVSGSQRELLWTYTIFGENTEDA